MATRNKVINFLVKEGFTHKTLNSFNDNQLNHLYKSMIKEQVDNEQTMVNKDDKVTIDKMKKNKKSFEVYEDNDVEETGKVPKGEEVLDEKYASKKQQKFFHAQAEKTDKSGKPTTKAKKFKKYAAEFDKATKKEGGFKNLPEKKQKEMAESYILGLVEKQDNAFMTKKNFIKFVNEQKWEDDNGTTTADPDIETTPTTTPSETPSRPGKIFQPDVDPDPQAKDENFDDLTKLFLKLKNSKKKM